MNLLRPELLDRLAREYALGTLHGPARRRFEVLLREAPAAAIIVRKWQERLAALNVGLPGVEPDAEVWDALQRRLFAGSASSVQRRGSRSWFAAPALSTALAGLFAGVVGSVVLLQAQPELAGLEAQSDAVSPSYIGLLTDAQGRAALLASVRRHERRLALKPLRPLEVPPGRVAQLWALPAGGGPPVPLGVVKPGGPSFIVLPGTAEQVLSRVDRLGVSFESAPALPGAAPTADFTLTGHCAKLW